MVTLYKHLKGCNSETKMLHMETKTSLSDTQCAVLESQFVIVIWP